ncbi:virulence factor (plasmid) [Cupriavidus oxalaticus]|uniref:Virulence factor n=1 Tax=Cupriavidus oxalaticus TaxID=96344 RepID=A0A5P3VRU9_9BURK|nr:virulence factor [Cupriavidus oxalaticus]
MTRHRLLAGMCAASALLWGSAMARSELGPVIGAPSVVVGVPPYAAPPPIYVAPPPLYEPAPVYYGPPPTLVRPGVYFGQPRYHSYPPRRDYGPAPGHARGAGIGHGSR